MTGPTEIETELPEAFVRACVRDAVRGYATAHRAYHKPTGPVGLLSGSPLYADLRLAADRALSAVRALAAWADWPDLPRAVAAFLAADADRECESCEGILGYARKHPECREKVARYFRCLADLVACGDALNDHARNRVLWEENDGTAETAGENENENERG